MDIIGRTAEFRKYLDEKTKYRFVETAAALSRLGGLIECSGPGVTDALKIRESAASSSLDGSEVSVADCYSSGKTGKERNAEGVQKAEKQRRAAEIGIRYVSSGGNFSAPLLVRLHRITAGNGSVDADALKELSVLMNRRTENILLDIASVRYFFDLLLPFSEGNGTVGRICTQISLNRYGIIRKGVLPLSRYFAEGRTGYVEKDCGDGKDFEDWVICFLNAVSYECERTERFLRSYAQCKKEITEKTENVRRLREMPDAVMENPFLRVSDVQSIFRVSQPTAASYLAQMESLGIFREIPSDTRWKLYRADGVLEVLDM